MGKVLHPRYFPFCTFAPDGNTSPPRTLAETMYEYWVAKTWRLRVFMQDNGAAFPPNPFYDFNFGLDATSEEDIVCNPNWIYKSGDITFPEFINTSLIMLIADDATSSRITGSATRFGEANDDSLVIGDLGTYIQTGTVSIFFGDGHIISVPIAIASQQPGADPAIFFEFITNAEITITEYWSYGGTYNTSTGQRP